MDLIKELMQTTENLAEALSSPEKWELEAADSESFEASFWIDDNEYFVDCYKDDKTDVWKFSFSLDDQVTKTGTGNEFKVLATVMNILEAFIKKCKPELFMFSANHREPSRVRLYDRISKNISTKHGYALTTKDTSGSKHYDFSKGAKKKVA